ncbi:MAG: hypothetical protein ACXIUM_01290 [Wenzhouxiangella sp.]
MNFRTKSIAAGLLVLTVSAPISAAGDAERLVIAEREIEQTAYFNRLEFLVQEMRVNDLDAELEPDGRPRGVELIFPTRVFNTTRATAQPGHVRPVLQWTDPATGDSFAVNAQPDFSAVPGEARTSGEFRFHVSPRDRERFDEGSAHLVFGQAGRTPAIVAIGSEVEGHSRLPVPQETEGWSFVVEGDMPRLRRSFEDTVTITRAEVMWMHGNNPLEDGTSLLEITYTVENNSTAQSCSQRGEGGWRLTLPNGDAVTDLRVSERCVAQGDRVEGIMTGFLIPTEDFAGEYVLAHRRGSGSDSDPWGELEITVTDGEGAVFLDRR